MPVTVCNSQLTAVLLSMTLNFPFHGKEQCSCMCFSIQKSKCIFVQLFRANFLVIRECSDSLRTPHKEISGFKVYSLIVKPIKRAEWCAGNTLNTAMSRPIQNVSRLKKVRFKVRLNCPNLGFDSQN